MEGNGTTSRDWQKFRMPLALRGGILLLILSSVLLIWLSNLYFTERFTQSSRSNAEHQLSLYSGRLISEIRRISLAPLLLSRDSELISALEEKEFRASSRGLISFQKEIGSAEIFLLNDAARVVAATDRRRLGELHKERNYFVEALRSDGTVFSASTNDVGIQAHFYSRQVRRSGETLGVIVIEVGLQRLFDTFSGQDGLIYLLDSTGVVRLSIGNEYRNRKEEEILAHQRKATPVERVLQATRGLGSSEVDTYIQGRPVFRLETRIPFQGWRLVYLYTFGAARARVNQIIALEIMAVALAFALGFYLLSRRAIRQSFLFKAESDELRRLNDRISAEMAERRRVEQSLAVAEQDLAQSEKLAALGELSAAVSHELNQPLAAVRTYVALARHQVRQNNSAEALPNFARIDHLIGRMAAITRQLKSYARKGGEDLVALDLRDAVKNSISMMAAQFEQHDIEVVQTIPETEVTVLGDMLRLEQVIVNLLRNAVDAMRQTNERRLEIDLVKASIAKLSVRDYGTGIEDLDNLFEPFFTTKTQGDGIGLGLAIASGIAKDLGGRLLARNAEPRGAVFELHLPRLHVETAHAAE